MDNNWIYYGVFLPREERAFLIERFKTHIPKGWRIYCDHMTVVFNDKSENAQAWAAKCEKYIGQKANLKVTHIGISDKALALRVSGFMSNNDIPHITIATSPHGKPVDSNYITNWVPVTETLLLSAVLDKVCRR